MRKTMHRVSDVNIVARTLLPTPDEAMRALPVPPRLRDRLCDFRLDIRNILDGKDHRLLAVVGPCSIHNTSAAMAYATRLKRLSAEIGDVFLPVMRVYFEKPRTTVGWKGFINDPLMDDSFHIERGLFLARKFLLQLLELGLPAGTEALDPITPQYIGDLVSWTAIGARTAESQTHREMASGLSTPVGFKNGTDGSLDAAVNAIKASRQPHHFLGITGQGRSAVFHTRGNRYGHIVLRGGRRPNYDARGIAKCEKTLVAAGLPANIVVDCSHGNSGKDPANQPKVLANCVGQILHGNRSIVGVMVESNITGGSQVIGRDLSILKPDVSVTDKCLGWDDTERMFRQAHRRLAGMRTDP
ncbi:MAG: 3-deoxy-7-phosphoheptulonate synthase [bacterium]